MSITGRATISRLTFLLSLSLVVGAVEFDPNAIDVYCPSSVDDTETVDLSSWASNTNNINIPIILHPSTPNRLCILHQTTSTGTYIPVGRSYHGNDWERVAGQHASLSYECQDNKCQVSIPPLQNGEEYKITAYDYSIDPRAKIARFLERGTFGTTKAALDSWNYAGGDKAFADWVNDQINTLPVSSHRAYYRQKLNPRAIETYRGHESGPQACEKLSRWRKFAFSQVDAELSTGGNNNYPAPGLTVDTEIKIVDNITAYLVKFDGHVRTVLYEPLHLLKDDSILDMDNKSYKLKRADEIEGSARSYPDQFVLQVNGSWEKIKGGNPTVHIDPKFISTTDPDYYQIDLSSLSNSDLVTLNNPRAGNGVLLLTRNITGDLSDAVCNALPDPYNNDNRHAETSKPNFGPAHRLNPDPPVFALLPDNTWAIHDTRVLLYENSLQNPRPDGGGSTTLRSAIIGNRNDFHMKPDSNPDRDSRIVGVEQVTFCANNEPNFVNLAHCKLSNEENACVRIDNNYPDTFVKVTLDSEALSQMKTLTNREVHIDSDTAFSDSDLLPCDNNVRSRWILVDSSECSGNAAYPINSNSSIHTDTENAFQYLLESSNGVNPNLRDVTMIKNGVPQCHNDDIANEVQEMAVLVASENQCWRNVQPNYMSIYEAENYVGRYGDDLSVISLISNLKIYQNLTASGMSKAAARQATDDATVAVAEALGVVALQNQIKRNRNGGVLVCGSPNEVAPDPYDDDYFDIQNARLDSITNNRYDDQKKTVWAMMALTAPDQLRQRMAWALSKTHPMSHDMVVDSWNTEANIYYYDLYVRHAFGSFRDLFKELAFSPKIGELLTFVRGGSLRYTWDLIQKIQFPDENYARESMQLHSIGLHELNLDGTLKLDENGDKIMTYDTKNILSFARVWTGFWYAPRRAGAEDLDHSGHTRMDPMVVNIEKHDWLPKRDLHGGWLGDKYPLCVDLPSQSFLRKGATFHLLGGTSKPRLQAARDNWDGDENSKHFVLKQGTSQLYDKLCQPSISGGSDCTFDTIVSLDSNLQCTTNECDIDMVRVVQVAPGVFYEYVRPPCVNFPFFDDGKKVTGHWNKYSMCSNPLMPTATRTCCDLIKHPHRPDLYKDRAVMHRDAAFLGERVTYEHNEEACIDQGGHVCDFTYTISEPSPFNDDIRIDHPWNNRLNVWHWTNETCTQQLKVQIDGQGALVHKVPSHNNIISFLSLENSVTYFSIPWEQDPHTLKEVFPTVENSCGDGACEYQLDNTCLCDVTVSESAVFSTMPTRDEVLSQLSIGAFDPAMLDDSYELRTTGPDGVQLYAITGDADYAQDTIFKTTNKARETIYCKNMQSMLSVGGGEYNIRNMPMFHDLSDITLRDTHYEIDELINHLVQHDNTAPFVSKLLIQQFGISNPSPRYVKNVATAFQNGMYEWTDNTNSMSFGGGKWGDLGAVAAAIILDREATSEILDADPAYGSLKEPLLKVIGTMKSLEYTRTPQDKMIYPILSGAYRLTGQQVYDAPDQFGFYNMFNSPPGQFAQSKLLAPEAELLTMTNTVGIINGLFAMNRNGMSGMDGGLGPTMWDTDYFDNNGDFTQAGVYDKSVGFLGYTPEDTNATVIVEELSTILTSGRLSSENKNIIANAYDYFYTKTDNNAERALTATKQLIATSPEFHSTSIAKKTGQKRNPSPKTTPLNEPYKAVVYVKLFGGLDSFNVLAPYDASSCPSSPDIFQEYTDARGGYGLKTHEMNRIDAIGQDQPCDYFGVNKKISIFSDLYDEGKGVFFANLGHLSKPVTKNNWRAETKTDLFSHFTMAEEVDAVDAFQERDATGILGRILDIMQDKQYAVKPISIHSNRAKVLNGKPNTGRKVDILSSHGVTKIFERDFLRNSNVEDLRQYMEDLNGETEHDSGFFSNHWSQNFMDVWNATEDLGADLSSVSLNQNFGNGINKQFETVAKLMVANQNRGINRDAFHLYMGGFDGHSEMKHSLDRLLTFLNDALTKFVNELKHQGLFDSVTVVIASEFGRTITANTGGGTDHAWGGNYFMFGGEVNGGKIRGSYPKSFTEDEETNIGRGRLIPTTSWDAVWYGISQWYGVTDTTDLEYVLPNIQNFGCNLFTSTKLYKNGTGIIPGCGGKTVVFDTSIFIYKPRYLTGIEQKQFCQKAIELAKGSLDAAAKCVIVDQQIIVNYGRRLLQNQRQRALQTQDPTYQLQWKTEITTDDSSTSVISSVTQLVEEAVNETATTFPNATGEVGTTEATIKETPAPTAMPTHSPTAAPTPAPTEGLTTSAGAQGDPHIRTWNGEFYDFHGVCDLVLLYNPEFNYGDGMDIHMRTKRSRIWSYISAAVLRIGHDTLEVMGGRYKNLFWINGLVGTALIDKTDGVTILEEKISGYPIQFKQISSISREFVVFLSGTRDEKVVFKTWNAYVSVNVNGATFENFQNSSGLMGTFPKGIKVARDNKTVFDDNNDFGKDWQVLTSEPKLFHELDGPQHPQQECEIPSEIEMRRRLKSSTTSKEDADIACSQVHADEYDLCVFDVMATSTKSVAAMY